MKPGLRKEKEGCMALPSVSLSPSLSLTVQCMIALCEEGGKPGGSRSRDRENIQTAHGKVSDWDGIHNLLAVGDRLTTAPPSRPGESNQEDL